MVATIERVQYSKSEGNRIHGLVIVNETVEKFE